MSERNPKETRTEVGSVTEALPGLCRQILTLSSVYQRSDDYYRAALMPVIKGMMARLEART